VRQNRNGRLVLVNYGVIEVMQIDPIEKKPFNHFMPNSYVLGIGTSSCNWGCSFCQNHNISKEREVKGNEFTPKEIVEKALKENVQGIAYTYNEPTIFAEFALDVAKEAKRNGLFNVFVTNGYMTPETVSEMSGVIDAAVVNIKGNAERLFANKYEMVLSNKPVMESLVRLKDVGIHIEITDLVIPGVGDSLEACANLCSWISDMLGKETPLHFTRFHPDYKMVDYPATPIETLVKHRDIAIRSGLEFVYIGNAPYIEGENTYCPKCKSLCVGRDNYAITSWNLDSANACVGCGHKIPIVGSPVKTRRRKISVLF
jgi:pyruvate formate lyase activating enzyme